MVKVSEIFKTKLYNTISSSDMWDRVVNYSSQLFSDNCYHQTPHQHTSCLPLLYPARINYQIHLTALLGDCGDHDTGQLGDGDDHDTVQLGAVLPRVWWSARQLGGNSSTILQVMEEQGNSSTILQTTSNGGTGEQLLINQSIEQTIWGNWIAVRLHS